MTSPWPTIIRFLSGDIARNKAFVQLLREHQIAEGEWFGYEEQGIRCLNHCPFMSHSLLTQNPRIDGYVLEEIPFNSLRYILWKLREYYIFDSAKVDTIITIYNEHTTEASKSILITAVWDTLTDIHRVFYI